MLRARTLDVSHVPCPLLLRRAQLHEVPQTVLVEPIDGVAQADDEIGARLQARGLGDGQPPAQLPPRSLDRVEILRALRVACQELEANVAHGLQRLLGPQRPLVVLYEKHAASGPEGFVDPDLESVNYHPRVPPPIHPLVEREDADEEEAVDGSGLGGYNAGLGVYGGADLSDTRPPGRARRRMMLHSNL